MSREWKPGDVAMVNGVVCGKDFVAIKGSRRGWYSQGDYHSDDQVTQARPLLVLDPEDREQVERLCEALLSVDMLRDGWDDGPRYRRTSAALRSLLAPLKPDEPQGLGAVVRDAEGTTWTRVESGEAETRNPWYPAACEDQPEEWANIAAVEVLAEGWTR